MKKNISEAIDFHLAGMKEDGDAIPASFKGDYELVYKFDTQSLLQYYKGIFNAPAFERLTGINQKQIHHYSSGLKRPRAVQKKENRKSTSRSWRRTFSCGTLIFASSSLFNKEKRFGYVFFTNTDQCNEQKKLVDQGSNPMTTRLFLKARHPALHF